jgi:hypothetical protein
MSKPFIVSVLESPTVVMRSSSLPSASVTLSSLGVSIEGDRVDAKTSSGDASLGISSADGVVILTSGAPFLAQIRPDNAIQLIGGDSFYFSPGGNMVISASDLIEEAAVMHQPMLTDGGVAVVSPADPDYTELSDVQAIGLAGASRLVMVPGSGGTTIRSLISVVGNPNMGGRAIFVTNGGTGAVELPDQDPAGTAGGRFSTPGHVLSSIEPGGGRWISFEPSIGPDGGSWVVA